jgi:hypothetical protein
MFGSGEKADWTGCIDDIQNTQFNLPLQFCQAAGGTALEVTVAFGKRFEPGITAANMGR